MPFQLSPGVNITEKDLTLIVPAVATTPGGICAPFAWGPAEEIIVLSSEKELKSIFGAPATTDSAYGQWWFTAANFLQYGNHLKVVRILDTTDKNSTGTTAGAAGTGLLIKNKTQFLSGTISPGSNAFAARYPGSLGDSLKVVILDGGSRLNTDGPGVAGDATENEYADYLSYFNGIPGTSTFATNLGNTSAGDEIHVLIIDEDGLFTGVKNTVLEKYEYLSKAINGQDTDGNNNFWKNVINENSEYIWALGSATGNNPNTTGGVTAWGSPVTSSSGKFAIVGASAVEYAKFEVSLAAGSLASSAPSLSTIASNYSTYFGDADTVDVSLLLGGPLGSNIISTSPSGTPNSANTIISVAESRKDCMAFVSPQTKVSNTAQENLDTVNNFKVTCTNPSSYGVMDSGWKLQYDKYNDRYIYVPLNGDTAGCCVRTDQNRDPWFSPAGFDRGRILNSIKLAYNPNKTHRDIMYRKGVNPVVTFDASGTVLFGDKTMLEKPSAFDRINVRRLFIVLEKAIATASKFILFEQNDEFTRSQFKSLIEPYLRTIQGRRGVTDFRVICDETNNTPQVIDSNGFVADIYIKPTRSINFIQLNFIATPTGLSFEEVVGA